MKSLGGELALQAALEIRVRKVIDEIDPESPPDHSDAIGVVCGIAADSFEKSANFSDRRVAQKAISFIAHSKTVEGSWESAAEWWERLLAIELPKWADRHTVEPTEWVTQYRQRIEILDKFGNHLQGCGLARKISPLIAPNILVSLLVSP